MNSFKYCVSLLILVFASNVYSQIGKVSGEVSKIRSHDTSLSTDGDWVSIDTIDAPGSCLLFDGKATFSMKGDDRGSRHLSILLAAKLAGKSVTIGYDDVSLNPYYCAIRYVDIN